MITKCNCENEFMDTRYGKSKRVANETTKGIRCTVCAKETIKTIKRGNK